jgi:hypothetical protein
VYEGGPLQLVARSPFSFFMNGDVDRGWRMAVSRRLRRIVVVDDSEALVTFYELREDGQYPLLGSLGGRGPGLHQFSFEEFIHAR